MKKHTNRRRFLQAAGAGAAALAAGGMETPAPAQQPPKEGLLASAQALADLVRARFGKHVSEEQMKLVRQSLVGLQAGAHALKNVRLENGNEPDFRFVPEID